MYPNHDLKVWVKSERYSGGSSLNIHLSKMDKIDQEIYEDIKSFGKTLQMGTFNGMIDMYELSDKFTIQMMVLRSNSLPSMFVYNVPLRI